MTTSSPLPDSDPEQAAATAGGAMPRTVDDGITIVIPTFNEAADIDELEPDIWGLATRARHVGPLRRRFDG